MFVHGIGFTKVTKKSEGNLPVRPEGARVVLSTGKVPMGVFDNSKLDPLSVAQAAGTEIAEQPGNVLSPNRLDRLEFDNEESSNQKIGEKPVPDRAVFIFDPDGLLWLHVQTRLGQPVDRGVFMHVFGVSRPEVTMDRERDLPDPVATFFDIPIVHFVPLVFLV
jgi:hypothetical protein